MSRLFRAGAPRALQRPLGARRCREAGCAVDRDRFARVQIPNGGPRSRPPRTHITGAISDARRPGVRIAGRGHADGHGRARHHAVPRLLELRSRAGAGTGARDAVARRGSCRSSAKHIRRNCSNFAMHRVPYVVTYAYRDDSPHCCIGFDNRAAFAQLTTHLLDLGHRDFAIIMQPSADNDRVQAPARHSRHAGRALRGAPRPSARRRGHDRIRAGEPARDRRQRRGPRGRRP